MDTQPSFRVIESGVGRHLFVVDGSRLYDIAGDATDEAIRAAIEALSPPGRRRIDNVPLAPPSLQTLSLNVAQACNMSCGYCYAGEGQFGGKARLMRADTARAAVDRLIAEAAPGTDLVIGFMGGEPFLNRALLHEITPYAVEAARACGHKVRFSLTTNATLLRPEDITLMAAHDFQVAVSIDGGRAANNALRLIHNGDSAYDRILGGLDLFESYGRPRHLSARLTVTPLSHNLVEQLEHVLSLGFDSAGFAPVLVSPDPKLAFSEADFAWFLNEMVECGERAKRSIICKRRYPFSNFETALQQLERGSHRPYACGAGAAYLSVNADGELFACHRLVDDKDYRFGDVWSGSDYEARARHLAASHVDTQQPCRSCWARYLCGGGCHHEVKHRGRPGCDYIRGWLEFCLAAYCEVKQHAPEYFEHPQSHFSAQPDAATSTGNDT
ncbi:radical SAM protein [Pseudomonas sp. NPDC087336]|uniref:radical SAM protein n=1 Tax=Pseudomonas sp. NPDC087336 TaxID=3364436 RepID=UPI0038002067